MLQILKPIKLKLIVALVVAISSFLASEIVPAAKEHIW